MKRYVKSARTGKQYEAYVVQEYVPGYGWEDVTVYDDTSTESWRDAKNTKQDYIDNGYNARVITRKLDNPNYAEPEHNIDPKAVLQYIENECPYPVKEIKSETNYMIGNWGHNCQVFIYDDGTVGVYNIGTNRTKTVYNLSDMIKVIDKICKV